MYHYFLYWTISASKQREVCRSNRARPGATFRYGSMMVQVYNNNNIITWIIILLHSYYVYSTYLLTYLLPFIPYTIHTHTYLSRYTTIHITNRNGTKSYGTIWYHMVQVKNVFAPNWWFCTGFSTLQLWWSLSWPTCGLIQKINRQLSSIWIGLKSCGRVSLNFILSLGLGPW